jgi:hypothetical protein
MLERSTVASDDESVCPLSEGKLPGVVLPKPASLPGCASLNLCTLRGMLETQPLGNVTTDKGLPLFRFFTPLEKLRRRNATNEKGTGTERPILAEPRDRGASQTGFDLALQVDQKR